MYMRPCVFARFNPFVCVCVCVRVCVCECLHALHRATLTLSGRHVQRYPDPSHTVGTRKSLLDYRLGRATPSRLTGAAGAFRTMAIESLPKINSSAPKRQSNDAATSDSNRSRSRRPGNVQIP